MARKNAKKMSDRKRSAEIAADVLAKVRANNEESQTLAALRNTLLPKLLSSEVRVPLPATS